MKIQILWEFDLGDDIHLDVHDRFAIENGVPLEVDLNEYFEDPASVSTYQVTDALSDEHGWLVKSWNIIK